MKVIIKRKRRQIHPDGTGSGTITTAATFVAGACPVLTDQSGTAPRSLPRSYTIVSIQEAKPTLVKRTPRKHLPQPSDLEMIALAKPEPKKESESDFSFELMSKSLVPDAFPSMEVRSKSPYAKRGA